MTEIDQPTEPALKRSADLLRATWRRTPGVEDQRLLEEMLSRIGTDGFAQGPAALAPSEAVSLAGLGDQNAVKFSEAEFAA